MSENQESQSLLAELEDALQYSFNDKRLLLEAFSHPSLKQQKHNNVKTANYQRLEFFGDAILGFIISEIIYKKYTDKDEGDLAKIKAYLVCKNTICLVAGKINLAKYLIMTEGEELCNGRNNPNNLENAMEALIAALYLDGEMLTTKKIVANLWQEHLSREFDQNINDPKTSLQEWSQSRASHEKPLYKVISTAGSAHAPIFTIEVSVAGLHYQAKDKTIKAAEKAAALGLLTEIKQQQKLL